MPRRMRKNTGIRNNYIFRLGKLHAIFATLEVFGKYTENSGLDRLYIETGIYGESTLRQTINGKHMKRLAEAPHPCIFHVLKSSLDIGL